MGSDRQRFEDAIEQAYREETGSSPSERSDIALQVIKRGRRHRGARLLGALGIVAVLAGGAMAAVDALPNQVEDMEPADGPRLGAEKVIGLGGPLAGYGDHLFVANSSTTNGPGDQGSIERLHVPSGDKAKTPPTSMAHPMNVAAGPKGLWMVRWSGDMPVGGAGTPVDGAIQLVDPVSGDVLVNLRRQDSAPYDVAVDARFPTEAWVVDSARNELLGIDGRSGSVAKVIELDEGPNTVATSEDAVWAGANAKAGQGALYRWDLNDGTLETFPVDHCVNDLYVLDDSVWAVDYCGGALHGFNATNGDRVSTIEIEGQPTAMAFADGDFWVTAGSQVVRIDPISAQVVGQPTYVAEGLQYIAAVGDTVYVSSWEGVFGLGEDAPIREPKPTPQEEVPPPGGTEAEGCDQEGVTCIPLDRPMAEVATGFGSAWVGNIGEGKAFGIARFDSQTGQETARLHTDGFTKAMAPDTEHMWALLERGGASVLQRIDPDTNEVVDSVEMGASGNIGEPSLAVGGNFVWVSGPNGSVMRISQTTHEADSTSYRDQLPGYDVDSGPLHLAYGEGRLWLSYGQGHVGEVDPANGELMGVLRDALGVNAYEIVVTAGQLWSPHQSVRGANIVSYVATSEDRTEGELELAPANPIAAVSDGIHLWVLQDRFEDDQPDLLQVIDPLEHRLIGEGLSVELGFGGRLAAGEGYVWVTGNNVLYRIEPGVAL